MIDYNALKGGFTVTRNPYSKYWVVGAGNGKYQFYLANEEYQARELERFLNGILEDLLPILEVCRKYNIDVKDLPETLEEYIAYDNEEYLAKAGKTFRG